MDRSTNHETRRGMRIADTVALVVLIIGGLNWGLVGLFNFNLVAALFGEWTVLSRLIYVLVGISAVWTAVRTPRLVGSHEAEAPPHPV